MHVWEVFFIFACAAPAYSILPVLAELVEGWRRITGGVSILYRDRQRRPGEQLLILGQAAAEGFPGSDGLQRN